MKQIVKVRRVDGRVVEVVSTGGSQRVPADTDEFRYVTPDKRIDPGRPQKLGRNGRFYDVPKRDLVTAPRVLRARNQELFATDQWALPDRPDNADWLKYRQALRDLPEGGRDVKTLLRGFPTRPDGTDAIEDMR